MPRGKMVYISENAHRQLRLLAARRDRPMGELVADLIEQDLADLVNAWAYGAAHKDEIDQTIAENVSA